MTCPHAPSFVPLTMARGLACFVPIGALLAALAGPAAAQPVPEAPAAATPSANSPERYRPQAVAVPFVHAGTTLNLVATHYRPPAGDGPFPLVVLSHGSDADADARRRFTPGGYWNPARYFLNRGFSVLYVLRPSYGASPGPYLEENAPRCDAADYGPGFEAMADVVQAAVAFGATLPQVDATRVLLVGHSAGGAATIAAAARGLPGVAGYVNFAAGKGGSEQRPYAPCQPDQIGRLYAGYAARTKVPSLWVYAPNDLYFGRDIGPGWHRAYQAAGGNAELVVTAPAADDRQGHHVVQTGLPLWIPAVDAWLKARGFSWR